MIPSARDRVVWGLLAAEPAFAFAGTRSRSVAVRSGGYEPPFCQYGGGTVAAVRKTNNLRCPKTRPFFKESLIISSAVAAGSFVPALRFETLEIHKVCLRISNLVLCQNLSPSTLAEITSDSLNAKTPELSLKRVSSSVSNFWLFQTDAGCASLHALYSNTQRKKKSGLYEILILDSIIPAIRRKCAAQRICLET